MGSVSGGTTSPQGLLSSSLSLSLLYKETDNFRGSCFRWDPWGGGCQDGIRHARGVRGEMPVKDTGERTGVGGENLRPGVVLTPADEGWEGRLGWEKP